MVPTRHSPPPTPLRTCRSTGWVCQMTRRALHAGPAGQAPPRSPAWRRGRSMAMPSHGRQLMAPPLVLRRRRAPWRRRRCSLPSPLMPRQAAPPRSAGGLVCLAAASSGGPRPARCVPLGGLVHAVGVAVGCVAVPRNGRQLILVRLHVVWERSPVLKAVVSTAAAGGPGRGGRSGRAPHDLVPANDC